MAIRGSLREASLPDVLQLLALGSKTGCLSVAHRNNFGYIYFDKGRISYASIVNRRDRLGDILVKNGAITQAQLDTAIDAQRLHREVRLGELLVARYPPTACDAIRVPRHAGRRALATMKHVGVNVAADSLFSAAMTGIDVRELTFGSLAGSMLPFLLRRIGFDPASASAPFVATLVDVTGLSIYFWVALLMLRGTLL